MNSIAPFPAYLAEYADDIGIPHSVELREHNPQYGEIFAREHARLMSAFKDVPSISVHHIGSTSVEGLCAKPIIDLLATYARAEDFDPLRVRLEAAGYRFRTDLLPNRRYFVLENADGVRYFSLSAFLVSDENGQGILRFRDRLRSDPGLVAEYAELKRQAAEKTGDRREYGKKKSDFIVRHSRPA